MNEFMEALTQNDIFVGQLESSDIPYHCKYLKSCVQPMTDAIKAFIKEPKLRSKKWISTSLTNNDISDELRYASAEYFVHNLINPVHFYDKLKQLPSDAIVVEIGPHSVFRRIVKETIESVSYNTLIKKDSNDTNLDNLLQTIANLYELGLNPDIEVLYPRVEWPVSRGTQSLSSLIRWDHNKSYPFKQYPQHFSRPTASDMNFRIDFNVTENQYYLDHAVHGKALFPAVGYLVLAWRIHALHLGQNWCETPVIFENIQFIKPLYIKEYSIINFVVKYSQIKGNFLILY